MNIRESIYEVFHYPSSPKARAVNGFISFVIVCSVAIFPLIFFEGLHPELKKPLELAEKITVTIFLIEYCLRVWSEKNPFKFIFSWSGLIDILAILPFFLERVFDTPYLWAFSLLRILRLFKFIDIMEFEQRAIEDPNFNPCKTILKLKDEKILKIVYKHPLSFIGNLAVPIVLLSISSFVIILGGLNIWSIIITTLLIILIGVLFFKLWLDFNNDFLLITSHRVIVQIYQLFGSTANAVGYNSILNIVADNRGFWNWLINSGKINIETAADQKTLVFYDLRNAHQVAQIITQQRDFAKNNRSNFSND